MTFQQIRNRADRLRSVPLPAVLLQTGAERDRYDQAKWHTDQGTISLTGMKFINWSRKIGGGGAIDLVMHLNGVDFRAAVEWLWNHFPNIDQRPPAQPSRKPSLMLPEPEPSRLPDVKHYLVGQRAIADALIQPLIESGNLYADNRGNAVFLMLGKDNTPVGAELRGTTPARWRGMAPGSQINQGYFSVSHPQAVRVILCESAIDAISCLALHSGYLCISTSGARSNPLWIPGLLSEGHEIYCGFDADSTGDRMAEDMMALHHNIKRLRPTQHDWNDVLKLKAH